MVEINCVLDREDAQKLRYIMHIRGFKSKAECLETLIHEKYERQTIG